MNDFFTEVIYSGEFKLEKKKQQQQTSKHQTWMIYSSAHISKGNAIHMPKLKRETGIIKHD